MKVFNKMIDIIETPSSLIKQILVQSLRKQVVYSGHWLVNLIQFIKVKIYEMYIYDLIYILFII